MLLTQFVGFPAALLFGRIGDRIGAKRAIWLALIVYVIVVFWAWRMTASWGVLRAGDRDRAGAGWHPGDEPGAVCAPDPRGTRRPPVWSANMMGKFAAVVGPLLVGWFAVWSGSARTGILSVLLLFLAGAWLLGRVRVAEGEREAAALGA